MLFRYFSFGIEKLKALIDFVPIEAQIFPHSAKEGARWYTRKQPCLMFKDNSKYPDKFLMPLVFSGSKDDQQDFSAFAIGQYELTDQAHGFDNRHNPICDYTKIKSISKIKS